MSRFFPKIAVPPPFLGADFVKNSATGLYDIDAITPQPLSSAILGTDAVLISRNIGTVAAPNWVPYYATPAQVQALSGLSSSGTVITFTGSAGAPTGARALTALPGSDVSTALLDGAGTLVMPSAAYQYGSLQAAGTVPAAVTITATFKAGGAGPIVIGRIDGSGANGGYVLFRNGSGLALVSRANNAETVTIVSSTALAGHVTVGVRIAADGVWHPQADGTDLAGASFTPPAVATGYVLVGSGDVGGTAISQVAAQ